MPTIITVHMYSGVPDPTWELTPEQEAELQNKIVKNRKRTFQQSPGSAGLLGYRGFEVRSVGDRDLPSKMHVFDSVLDIGETDEANFVDSDSDLELFLLKTGKKVLRKNEADHITETVQKNASGGMATSLSDYSLDAVPPYNPGKWNNDPYVKKNNNCYNYSNDKITNTFAQPGRGSGQMGPFPPTCNETGAAAERDGQVKVRSPSTTPSDGHYIALVIWPGNDYHWYRLDSNAMWSHKPGQTAARNTDNSGNLISNPETSDRGPYTIFCGYYHCDPSKTNIR